MTPLPIIVTTAPPVRVSVYGNPVRDAIFAAGGSGLSNRDDQSITYSTVSKNLHGMPSYAPKAGWTGVKFEGTLNLKANTPLRSVRCSVLKSKTKIIFWLVLSAIGSFLVACGANETKAQICARHAAHPEEKIRIDDEPVGMPFGEIVKADATQHCRDALAETDDPATAYHLARALMSGALSQENLDEARGLVTRSIERGYDFANLGAGYIAYTYEPANGLLAIDHYRKAQTAGASVARTGIGYALLYSGNTADRRDEGVAVFEDIAKQDPNAYLVLASYHKGLSDKRPDWQTAETYLKAAKQKGVAQANLDLATLYWDEKSPIRSVRLARAMAEDAVDAGLTDGYDIWVRSYYFTTGVYKNNKTALIVARNGSKAGHVYSAYLAGHMLALGEGVDKNTLEAEQHLKFATAQGSTNAQKLLNDRVTARANILRRMPSSNAQNCVKSRVTAYDRNVIDYRNGCSTGLNTLACSRHVATELFSFFDGKDRERCRRKYVAPGQYIDNFYGANENSSLARKAISNTNVKIGACHPPLQPYFNGNKVMCKEE